MSAAAADFVRVSRSGAEAPILRPIAAEVPVAIEVNGVGYAVLMATPADLDDLATGFLLAERVLEPGQVPLDVVPHEAEGGILLRVAVGREAGERLAARVRHRTSDSSCGLCGIESLEQALRPLPTIEVRWRGATAAIFAALDALGGRQVLNRETRAVHAAARCAADGAILMVREDVGRHNAFDKLIGAMARAGQDWDGGFALLSSRCSYELVEKAVLAGCPMLATISAPTTLAVERARGAGLPLYVLARPDAVLAAAG